MLADADATVVLSVDLSVTSLFIVATGTSTGIVSDDFAGGVINVATLLFTGAVMEALQNARQEYGNQSSINCSTVCPAALPLP